MGNKNSFQSHLDIVDLNTNYIADAKHTDSRFGEIKLLRRRETGEKIYQKDFTSNSTQEFEEYVNKIRKRVVLIHPNLLKVLGYNSKKEDLFCADFYRLSVFFESFETDLEKEIYQRAETSNYYTETELRCLLDSVIAACAYLEKNQISHTDIRPFNIFITKGREYKVCDSGLFQSIYNPSYFGLLSGLEAKSHYPSPQVFKHYKDKESRVSDFNPYKNDVFGLGMTILAAAQLKHIDTAYDYKTRKVRQEIIDDSLRHIKGRYSEGFVEALRVLLSQEETKRPTFVELDDEIKAYRSDIRAKANLERTLEAQRRHGGQEEVLVRSPNRNPPQSNPSHYVADNESDNRVRKAIEKSESNINSKSPNRFQNPAIDQHVQSYIRRESLQSGDKPLLYNVAPHLRMNDRFTPTLKVYGQSTNQPSANPQQYRGPGDATAHTAYGGGRIVPQSGGTGIGGQTFVTGSPYTNTNTNYNYGGGYGQPDSRVESAAYRGDPRAPNSGNYLAQNYL